jgi:hypothetical protein
MSFLIFNDVEFISRRIYNKLIYFLFYTTRDMFVEYQRYLFISPRISEEYPNIKYNEISPGGIRVVATRKTDMTQLILALRNFGTRLKL